MPFLQDEIQEMIHFVLKTAYFIQEGIIYLDSQLKVSNFALNH